MIPMSVSIVQCTYSVFPSISKHFIEIDVDSVNHFEI